MVPGLNLAYYWPTTLGLLVLKIPFQKLESGDKKPMRIGPINKKPNIINVTMLIMQFILFFANSFAIKIRAMIIKIYL